MILILASVSINLTLGKNGILNKTKYAKEKTIVAEEKEEISIALLGIATNKKGDTTVTAEELENELKNNTKKDISVTGSEILEVLYVKTEHSYMVDGNGNIEETVTVAQVTDPNPGELEGEGTETNPFKVSSIEDLVAMSKTAEREETAVAYDGKYFELTTDLNFKSSKSYIDAQRTDMGDVNKDGKIESLINELTTGNGFIPIGLEYWNGDNSTGGSFNGNFNGMNHSIINLYIGKENCIVDQLGLFGNSNKGIVVRNLNMVSVDISTSNNGYYAGAIVGYCSALEGDMISIVENCSVTGTIIGENTVGGLIGMMAPDTDVFIRDCRNYANVTAAVECAGGIIGQIWSDYQAVIENCENYGEISCEKYGYVGGIGGDITPGTSGKFKNCTNYGDVILNPKEENSVGDAGGVFGRAFGSIEACTNFGKVYTEDATGVGVGGVVGTYDSLEDGNGIKNCYNKGDIVASKNSCVGGIAGRGYVYYKKLKPVIIENCYNTGIVKGNEYVGGCIGFYEKRPNGFEGKNVLKNCYNVGIIEGVNNIGGIVGSTGSTVEEAITLEIENCYNVGNVTGNEKSGGIVGLLIKDSVVTNSYYLKGTSDIAYTTEEGTTSNTEEKTTDIMTSKEFVNTLNKENTENIWKVDEENINSRYPILN